MMRGDNREVRAAAQMEVTLALEGLVRITPIGTVIIALGALGIPTWSLLAQTGVSRRRAAIDFFLKTEMSEKLLIAYKNAQ